MKKSTFLGFFLTFTLLTGCGAKQVHKNWYALDGSRADATVKVALSWNPEKEVPLSDQNQADKIAEERCKAWGYNGAEMFGAVTQKCTQMGYTGFTSLCLEAQSVMTYQCLGNPNQTQHFPPNKNTK